MSFIDESKEKFVKLCKVVYEIMRVAYGHFEECILVPTKEKKRKLIGERTSKSPA